jgi:hypothetical protein
VEQRLPPLFSNAGELYDDCGRFGCGSLQLLVIGRIGSWLSRCLSRIPLAPNRFDPIIEVLRRGKSLVGGMHGIVHDRVSSDNALCINESVLDGISKRLRNVVPIYR